MFNGNKIYKIDRYGNRKRFWGIIPGLTIRFKGKNSTVELYEPIPKFSKCRFRVKDNSLIRIGASNYEIKKLLIWGESNQKFTIGKNFSTLGCELISGSEDFLTISIGDNCMFDRNIVIRSSDGHCVIDKSGKILNYGKDIAIGNNVWIAGNVEVLKGVNIGSNSIIGHGSVVTKNCEESCTYAGIPAKLVKKDVTWQREFPAVNKTKYPIDLVYLWCDINDEKYKKKKEDFEKRNNIKSNTNSICRFVSNDELKYSLRSVEKYASWINKIFIVTDNQIPEWLNTKHPKITVISHYEIMPAEALPSYNSNAIEHCIVNIPNLSEHFLYANDDMFFASYVASDFFFQNGNPINRFGKPFNESENSDYTRSLNNAKNLIKTKYCNNFNLSSHHNIDAYRKSYILECQKKFKTEIYSTICNNFRCSSDVQRIIYNYYSVLDKNCKMVQINKKSLFKKQCDSVVIFPQSHNKLKKICKFKPKLFCINDNETATESDRKNMVIFLESLFNEKSSFEK